MLSQFGDIFQSHVHAVDECGACIVYKQIAHCLNVPFSRAQEHWCLTLIKKSKVKIGLGATAM